MIIRNSNTYRPMFKNGNPLESIVQNAPGTTAADVAKGGKLAGFFGNLKGKFSGLNNISLRNLLKGGKIGDPEL